MLPFLSVIIEEKKPFLSALDENENPDDALIMKIKPQEDFQGKKMTTKKHVILDSAKTDEKGSEFLKNFLVLIKWNFCNFVLYDSLKL